MCEVFNCRTGRTWLYAPAWLARRIVRPLSRLTGCTVDYEGVR